MKKVMISVAIVVMLLMISVVLVACPAKNDSSSSELTVGTYKFYSMSGSAEGISINVKVGDSFMGMITLTEDYVVMEIKENGEASLTISGQKMECTWEEKEGKYYLVSDGEPEELIVKNNTLTMENDGMKLVLKKSN